MGRDGKHQCSTIKLDLVYVRNRARQLAIGVWYPVQKEMLEKVARELDTLISQLEQVTA